MHPDDVALAAVALEVAKHLEGDWTPDPEYPRVLMGPCGLRLLFTRSHATPRGAVEGLLPDEARGLHLTAEDRKKTSIGVDLGRPPAVIAREIERRLLPGFEELLADLADGLRRMAHERALRAGRVALFELLAPLAPEGVQVEALTDAEVRVTACLGEAEARVVFAALQALRGTS